MKANRNKSHLLLNCSEPSTTLIDGSSIESNTKEILLGITIERTLQPALETGIFQPGLKSKTAIALCLYVMISKCKPLSKKYITY